MKKSEGWIKDHKFGLNLTLNIMNNIIETVTESIDEGLVLWFVSTPCNKSTLQIVIIVVIVIDI